jgi:ferredoxin
MEGDIALIGMPVYGYRIPKLVYPFFKKVRVDNKPAVIVVVYGNVTEGFALEDLQIEMEKVGFTVIAAGSFIGEHSFSTATVPVAPGRPDFQDLAEAELFGEKISEKLKNTLDLHTASIKISRTEKILYGTLWGMIKLLIPQHNGRMFTKQPAVNMDLCDRCGACIAACPMSAIQKDSLAINEGSCLRCFACAKKCHRGARRIRYKQENLVSFVLRSKNKRRHSPQIRL